MKTQRQKLVRRLPPRHAPKVNFVSLADLVAEYGADQVNEASLMELNYPAVMITYAFEKEKLMQYWPPKQTSRDQVKPAPTVQPKPQPKAATLF